MVRFRRQLDIECLEARKMLTGLLATTGLRACVAEESKLSEDATASVQVDNVRGLRAAEFRFQYDAENLEIDAARVKAGAAWQEMASVIAKVDGASGTIDVFVFSTNPIAQESGELIEFDFDLVDPTALNVIAGDVANRVEMTKSELNEGQIQSSARLMIGSNAREMRKGSEGELETENRLAYVREVGPASLLISEQFGSAHAKRTGPL